MEKTEKSMTELQIEANENLQLDKMTVAGRDLTPLHGPGFVGLHNLGNSCYMNSVLLTLPTDPHPSPDPHHPHPNRGPHPNSDPNPNPSPKPKPNPDPNQVTRAT